ncbi:hypothetical protein ABVF61_22245 [Roseibium sp. HPY-6]|uniref:hypothetical protein n=1 Tax=Roseibium sp. HPY-6 TaxID=3229852 RepID=UPI00338ED271
MNQSGYSGRPLAAKLGLKPGMTCWRLNMPDEISGILDEQVPELRVGPSPASGLDCAHLFITEKDVLAEQLGVLRRKISPDGMIWVSWPKKSSKVPTSVTEDVIREVCLPMGLVDVKVCAVDAVWSGLKLVIRKELRSKQAQKSAV